MDELEIIPIKTTILRLDRYQRFYLEKNVTWVIMTKRIHR